MADNCTPHTCPLWQSAARGEETNLEVLDALVRAVIAALAEVPDGPAVRELREALDEAECRVERQRARRRLLLRAVGAAAAPGPTQGALWPAEGMETA